jgi:hypothetical protein
VQSRDQADGHCRLTDTATHPRDDQPRHRLILRSRVD